MKLEKYLADYLAYEHDENNVPVFHEDYLEQFIKQGLNAFESTEDVTLAIVPNRELEELRDYADYVEDKNAMQEVPFTLKQWRQANVECA